MGYDCIICDVMPLVMKPTWRIISLLLPLCVLSMDKIIFPALLPKMYQGLDPKCPKSIAL